MLAQSDQGDSAPNAPETAPDKVMESDASSVWMPQRKKSLTT
ncbi:hypothetical protein THIOSC13_930003 [uncultured Thiomicrorhabdus sp.]